MACEHTYNGNTLDLLNFIEAHHPDSDMAWQVEQTVNGAAVAATANGSLQLLVRLGHRVRWSPNSIPGGRFEVRPPQEH